MSTYTLLWNLLIFIGFVVCFGEWCQERYSFCDNIMTVLVSFSDSCDSMFDIM